MLRPGHGSDWDRLRGCVAGTLNWENASLFRLYYPYFPRHSCHQSIYNLAEFFLQYLHLNSEFSFMVGRP